MFQADPILLYETWLTSTIWFLWYGDWITIWLRNHHMEILWKLIQSPGGHAAGHRSQRTVSSSFGARHATSTWCHGHGPGGEQGPTVQPRGYGMTWMRMPTSHGQWWSMNVNDVSRWLIMASERLTMVNRLGHKLLKNGHVNNETSSWVPSVISW